MIADRPVAGVRDQDKFHVRERLFRKCLGMDADVEVLTQPGQQVLERAVGKVARLAFRIEIAAVEQDGLVASRVGGGGSTWNRGEPKQGGQRWNCKATGAGSGHTSGITGFPRICQHIVGFGSHLALHPGVKLISAETVEGK